MWALWRTDGISRGTAVHRFEWIPGSNNRNNVVVYSSCKLFYTSADDRGKPMPVRTVDAPVDLLCRCYKALSASKYLVVRA